LSGANGNGLPRGAEKKNPDENHDFLSAAVIPPKQGSADLHLEIANRLQTYLPPSRFFRLTLHYANLCSQLFYMRERNFCI
jgi:hypothetical protein